MAALAAVVGLFLLASRSDGESSATNLPPVAQGAARGQPTAGPATKTAQPKTAPRAAKWPAPTIEQIVVRGGEPVGGVKRLEYERGERVRFSVLSDAADEVHVHGFDIEKSLAANRSVRFGFPAHVEGVFEVELHSGHTKIADLVIRP